MRSLVVVVFLLSFLFTVSAQTRVQYTPAGITVQLPPGWQANYGEQDLENPSLPPSFVITPEGTERGDGIPLIFSVSTLSLQATFAYHNKHRPAGKGEYGDTQEIDFDIYANPARKLILSTDQDYLYQMVVFSNDDGKTIVAKFGGTRREVEPLIPTFDAIIDSVRSKPYVYSNGYITADGVRVRNNPTTTASIADTLTKNSPVRYSKKGPLMSVGDLYSPWFFVEYGAGKKGWVYGFYVQWTGK